MEDPIYSVSIADFLPTTRVIISTSLPTQLKLVTAIHSVLQPTLPDLPQDDWVVDLRHTILSLPYSNCSIYTDGAWKDSADTLTNYLMGSTDILCAASLVIMRTTDWESAPLQAIKITNDGLAIDSAFGLELLAIAAAVSISTHTTIYTDCRSAVQILSRPDLNKQINQDYYFVLNHIHILLRLHQNSLVWVPSHAERRQPNKSLWTQHDWGNVLADAVASNHPLNHAAQFQPQLAITTSQVLRNCNFFQWAWTSHGLPFLLSPLNHIKQSSHKDYIATRDSHRLASSTVPWNLRSVSLAARLLDTSTITQQARTCRLVYDLYQHGRNRAKSGAHSAECRLCSHPSDSLKHIIVDCPHPAQKSIRSQYFQQFSDTIQQSNHHITSRILREIKTLALTHADGYLVLFGVWTQHLVLILKNRLVPTISDNSRYPKYFKRYLTGPLRVLADMTQVLASQAMTLNNQLAASPAPPTYSHRLRRRTSTIVPSQSPQPRSQPSISTFFTVSSKVTSTRPQSQFSSTTASSDHHPLSQDLSTALTRKRSTMVDPSLLGAIDPYIVSTKRTRATITSINFQPQYWTHPNDFNNTHSPATVKRKLDRKDPPSKKLCQSVLTTFFQGPPDSHPESNLSLDSRSIDNTTQKNLASQHLGSTTLDSSRPLSQRDLDSHSNQLDSQAESQNDYFALHLGLKTKVKTKKKKTNKITLSASQSTISSISLTRGPLK